MSFIDEQFPVIISRGSEGGPQYQTSITVCASGIERVNQNWEYPKHVYEASFGVPDNSHDL